MVSILEFKEENSQEELENSNQYVEEIDIDNYVEINENATMIFNDWMYDAIINKTVKEAEDEHAYDLIDLLNESRRDSVGFLSLLHLERQDFRMLYRCLNKAYKKSYEQEKRVYIRKAHNQFLKRFQELIELITRDERYGRF